MTKHAWYDNNYDIKNFQVIYKNYDNQQVVLSYEQLNERNSEATVMFEVILGFAEKKNKELQKS